MSVRPLITICGTTGVGKSHLAIELALMLRDWRGIHGWKGARIINADSMQVYAGMDVITNKVPESERQGIEHLLMGFKQPGEQYVVGQWVQDAITVIDETHNRNQIPIVVGGTSYWIQHLIFPDRLVSSDWNASAGRASGSPVSPELTSSLAKLPPHLLDMFNSLPEHPPSASTDADAAFSLHNLLSALDPIVAGRWHWRDTRKVLRSLHIIKDTGKKLSEIISEQSEVVVKPRYRTLCFWLYAEPSALNSRLDLRVDKMIKQGLLEEIAQLQQIAGSFSGPSTPQADDQALNAIDYTLGIYQAIGYREFHHYIQSSNPSDKAFAGAVDSMKLSTRKYAKRQVSWIRNKLLPAICAANDAGPVEKKSVPTYLLDATELGDKWNSRVRGCAIQITRGFLDQQDLPDSLALSDTARAMLTIDDKPIDPTAVLMARRKTICHICTLNEEQPVMIEEGREWEAHQNTRLHRRLSRKASRDDDGEKANPQL